MRSDAVWRPTAAMIPRVADAISYLYLDRLKVTQDDTGVCARRYERYRKETMYLPVASINAILLGPGTSITNRAVATIQRHNCTLVWVGDGGVRTYASAPPASQSTRWLEAQATAWADVGQRTAVVRRMFKYRFPDDDVKEKTIEQIRGMEGARVRSLYRSLAKKYGLTAFKRSYNPSDWSTQDPVNQALSSANVCLYGIVRAAIASMGCSPSLGFLHSGTEGSFAYDIADLYKAELTIPLAFSKHNALDPEGETRRSFRDRLHLFGLLPRIVSDIQYVLTGSGEPIGDTNPGVLTLWDDQKGPVASGVNYGGEGIEFTGNSSNGLD